uniref:Elongator complex protein 4 n=1 Tax=Rhipicephalus zambeziensis TaxID=60191 RepID=A0A224YWQ2_9ACAR
MSSSFQKSTRPAHRGIAGTKLSPHTAETVLSCGVSALDYILGGGLPLGGILLVEEDAFGTYCGQLLKYYVAEGIEQQHHIYFASGDFEPTKFLRELPRTLQVATGSTTQHAPASVASDGDLKIAFRYERMAKQDSLLDYEELDHVFDFSDRIESAKLASACVVTFDPCERWREATNGHVGATLDPNYESVLAGVSRLVDEARADENQSHFAVRIALQGLCSPTWGSVAGFSSFLHTLKAVIRGEPVSVFVTVPAVITRAHPSVLRRCRRLADIVLKIQAFDDHERGANPLYKNYHGLLQIVKLCRLSSLGIRMPECDFLFHQRSKKFVVERLHLPPELGPADNALAESKIPGLACASNQKFSF